jgi:hypothetical protein
VRLPRTCPADERGGGVARGPVRVELPLGDAAAGNAEIVLAAVVSKLPIVFWTAVAVTTLGNTVGGMTS